MSRLVVGSVCSGIAADAVAWGTLGWEHAFFAEIDPFPSAVLARHHPEVPNLGDFTKIAAGRHALDVLVGGTPCQSFSVAGLRGGLDDERGNLALEFLRLADRLGPEWLVWENVPGVLSSNGGRDLGAFLGGLAELGYGWAYRVLDAQYFGVPQRRRRVFVVGHLGDWRRAAAVLFERHCLSGDPPPRRAARPLPAGGAAARPGIGGPELARTLTGHRSGSGRLDGDTETFIPELAYAVKTQARRVGQDWNDTVIAHTLRADGFDASEDGTGRGTPLVPVPYVVNAAESGAKESHARPFEVARCLDSNGSFASAQGGTVALDRMAVRRLTPRECERLQGFPDDYTLVEYRGGPAKDGPRYRAIGNSIATPVLLWIGLRIERVAALLAGRDSPRGRGAGRPSRGRTPRVGEARGLEAPQPGDGSNPVGRDARIEPR